MKAWTTASRRLVDEELQPRWNKRVIAYMFAVIYGNQRVRREKEVKFSALGHTMDRIREDGKPARV